MVKIVWRHQLVPMFAETSDLALEMILVEVSGDTDICSKGPFVEIEDILLDTFYFLLFGEVERLNNRYKREGLKDIEYDKVTRFIIDSWEKNHPNNPLSVGLRRYIANQVAKIKREFKRQYFLDHEVKQGKRRHPTRH